jgi:hypothetical protein
VTIVRSGRWSTPIELPIRRIGSRLAWLCVIASSTVAAADGAAGPPETIKLDCGASALFVLLRFEKRPVTLDRLESALPPRHPKGYSMAELASAAASLGLDLEGVRYTKGDKALTRPAIAFLKDPRGGHFAVLRPVGTTGTMVQVIDPPGVPWIADYDRICSSKSWTGRILVPRDPWILRNAIPALIAAAGFVMLMAGIGHGLRTGRLHSSR